MKLNDKAKRKSNQLKENNPKLPMLNLPRGGLREEN